MTVTLTFPDGTTFSARGNIQVNYQFQNDFFLSPGAAISTAFAQFVNSGGADGTADGLGQNIYAGQGLTHTFEVSFSQWEGSTDQWGGVSAGADVVTKLQALDRTLNTVKVDSESPIQFEHAEYSSGGSYDPINVVVAQGNLGFDAEQQASTFDSNLTLLEATDAREAIDALQETITGKDGET